MKKILILLLKLIGALFIVGAIGVFAIIIRYRLELPNMQSMVEDYKPQMATIIYDKNNNVVDTLSVEAREVVKLELKDEYYNMGEIIKDHMYVVDIAKQAVENLGIKPIIKPIRGGTDGSKISFMGLPTPNIFAGGENFHGKYEFVALESMEKATDVIVEIVKLNAER